MKQAGVIKEIEYFTEAAKNIWRMNKQCKKEVTACWIGPLDAEGTKSPP
jgi:hypothetical protein